MTDSKYNGWANYETWLTKLWIDTEQEWQKSVLERAASLDAYDLSQSIREEIEENTPETTGLYADLMNAAIAAVDWYEIGAAYAEEAADNAKYA